MSIHVNMHMSKIMCMPIKLSIHMHVTYANGRTLMTNMPKKHADYFQSQAHKYDMSVN